MQDEPAIPMARTMAGVQADARPRVSVIMANYRGAAYLAASMRAVLAQTEARLELILADDGSDDDSLEIARDIARSDDRVRVLDFDPEPRAGRNPQSRCRGRTGRLAGDR